MLSLGRFECSAFLLIINRRVRVDCSECITHTGEPAIPGYTNFQQMEEDFSVAYDLEYTKEEKKFLEDRKAKLAISGYCQQCSRCLPTCPNGVDIPALMRTHMYAACYSNFYQARDTLDEIPRGKSIQICRSCKTCVARCVNSVNIARRIDELKMIYI